MSMRESTAAPPGLRDLQRNRPDRSIRWIHSKKRLQRSGLTTNTRLQAELQVFTRRLALRGASHTACVGTVTSVTRVGDIWGRAHEGKAAGRTRILGQLCLIP